jgi:uncharacterized repeat protein (TIGR01451 family)
VVNPGAGATPTIYQSNGTSYAQITNPFPAQQFAGRFVFADFNGDGRVDALNQTGNTSAAGITLYLNNGDGTFTTIAQPTNGAFTSGPFAGIEFTQVVSSTVFAVNTSGSGAANLIIDDQGAGAVPKVYFNNGSGFMQITSPFPAQQFTGRFVFGDFTGDGQIDILNQTGNQAGQGITLYEYTGNGAFTSIAKPDDSTAGAGDAPFTSGPFAGIDFTQVLNSQFLVGDWFNNGNVDIDESQNGASRELVQQVPQTADLSVSETISNATPNVGDQITFTETLSNLGPDAATGAQLTDLLPAGLSFVAANPSQGTYNSNTGLWTVGTVNSGAPQTLSITATVVSPATQTNTGTISHADQFDPNTANNTASATETPQQADLSVSETVSNATPNVGDQITFTETLSNLGPDAATGVQLTDLLPAGLSFVSATPSQGTYNNTSCLVPAFSGAD